MAGRLFSTKAPPSRLRETSYGGFIAGVIEAVSLTKRYGDLVAVDHVDLAIQPGSFFGVLGPNGAGKTVLLEMIEGLRKPDEGSARILVNPAGQETPSCCQDRRATPGVSVL